MGQVHFHSSDDRFCGSHQEGREFTFEPNDVTCQECMDRDCFTLSPEAMALVQQWNAEATRAAQVSA